MPDEITLPWVEVDPARLRVERVQDFGAHWLGLQVLEKLGLIAFLDTVVEKIERQYGKAERIWVMDRGMVSKKALAFLQAEGRRRRKAATCCVPTSPTASRNCGGVTSN